MGGGIVRDGGSAHFGNPPVRPLGRLCVRGFGRGGEPADNPARATAGQAADHQLRAQPEPEAPISIGAV